MVNSKQYMIPGQPIDTNNSSMLVNAGQQQVRGGSRKSDRQSSNSNFESQLSLMSNTTMSSIPGKTQRILINKKQPFSASAAAARVFKRG
jgi:hypothetical protein